MKIPANVSGIATAAKIFIATELAAIVVGVTANKFKLKLLQEWKIFMTLHLKQMMLIGTLRTCSKMFPW